MRHGLVSIFEQFSRILRIALALALALCLGCGSGEPSSDEFTGVWTDGGSNTLEFVSPNMVVWTKTRKTNRSYKKDGRMVKEKDAVSRSVKVGLYRRQESQLTLAWISNRRSPRKSAKATEFEVVTVGETSLQLKTDADPWLFGGKSEKEKPLELTLQRSNPEGATSVVGLWQSEKKQHFQGRLLTQSGVLVDIGKSSPYSQMEGRSGAVHDIKSYLPQEGKMDVRDLNWVDHDHARTHKVYYRKDGSKLTFLRAKEKERGLSIEEGLTMKRVSKALSLDTNRRIKWSWPEAKEEKK